MKNIITAVFKKFSKKHTCFSNMLECYMTPQRPLRPSDDYYTLFDKLVLGTGIALVLASIALAVRILI